ncbi:MAG TPA: zf-HC2 domain-containing protein [Gemmataceae bacterium]|nr:zf-HC2 domain-containing protein [Gemmataceae bacterium]
MKCTDVRAALPLLIYGEPSPEDTALREHLASCPACRREHEALTGVRRLLDDVSLPRIAVDLPQLHRSLAERQLRRARRWRRIAAAMGAVAAMLLLAIGLRLEVRLEASQLVVRWGEPPPVGRAFQPDVVVPKSQAGEPDLLDDLRVLSDLIHALKQDADERDQLCAERLNRLEKHVRALQSQGDLRWSATEESVAALYLLSRKGEKP